MKASRRCGRGPLFGQIVVVSNRAAIYERIAKAAPAGLNPKSKAVGTVFRRLTAASQSARQS
jgi:hypothetical protein